jgi:hypothetical protein
MDQSCEECKWWNDKERACMYNYDYCAWGSEQNYVEESRYAEPIDDCGVWEAKWENLGRSSR